MHIKPPNNPKASSPVACQVVLNFCFGIILLICSITYKGTHPYLSWSTRYKLKHEQSLFHGHESWTVQVFQVTRVPASNFSSTFGDDDGEIQLLTQTPTYIDIPERGRERQTEDSSGIGRGEDRDLNHFL